MSKGIFGVVAGPRLGGKTTLAGTLPGKTVMIQAAIKESGSRSAVKLAKQLGNELEVQTFSDLIDLLAKLDKAAKSDCDHVYIDGFTAINDMRWAETDIQRAYKNNAFDAYKLQGEQVGALLEKIKMYSYPEQGAKNVWLTAAMKGEGNDVKMECKGQMAVTALTKLGEVVVTSLLVPSEQGSRRVLITKDYEGWRGRIDGLLDSENPGYVDPDLSIVMKYSQGDLP
jgi:hypothetical protein